MPEPSRPIDPPRRRKRASGTRSPAEAGSVWPGGFGGYADLLRAAAASGREAQKAAAELLGYVRTARSRTIGSPAQTGQTIEAPPPVIVSASRLADIPFWQPWSRDITDDAAPVPASPAPHSRVPDDADIQGLPDSPPAHRDLAPWNALLPRLRGTFAEWAEGRALDLPPILERLARSELLGRLPRKPKRRWGQGVQVIIDRSRRLVPFWRDQDRVLPHLVRLFPERKVELWTAYGGPDDLLRDRSPYGPYALPPAGTLVLVLGDLGCLDRNPPPLVARWAYFGRRLRLAGCRPCALTPGPCASVEAAALADWTLLPWEPTGADAPAGRAQREAIAERVLRACAVASRIEPGLLRDLRLLLGADAGIEAAVWQDPRLVSQSSDAATLDPEYVRALRATFVAQEKDPALRARVVECIRFWRGSWLSPSIWAEELANLDPDTRSRLPDRLRQEAEAGHRFFDDVGRAETLTAEHKVWARRVFPRAVEAFLRGDDPATQALRQRLWLEIYRGRPDMPPPPPGYDTRLDPQLPDGERVVTMIQSGPHVVLSGPGSLLAQVRTGTGTVGVDVIAPAFWADGAPPPWAHAWGRDAFGPWVTFGIPGPDGGQVTQRMRWSPPGRFAMGSPDDEEGRYPFEGPVHEVVFRSGFWMFDTPCTEALWRAVMRRAPRGARGPAFPVTEVSWNDAQTFVRRLNAAMPGLALCLPSESQWEYACRAGTTTPYSFGPAIDPDRVRFGGGAGPVPAGSLPANAWGLHEMHGNVWEWCADHWHGDYQGAPDDGSAWTAEGGAAGRVIRGGSWGGDARLVRAAMRSGDPPANRGEGLGFRCARVQDSGAEPVAAPADPASRAGAERARPPGSPGADAVLRLGEADHADLPPSGTIVIHTDRETLRLRQITCPPWAGSIGRDAHGLYAAFTVPGTGITQRLRWIPPGRFMMGSPEGEQGRDDDEGPVHPVTLRAGFWLFDTPCTQALWQAVMGGNPSRFVDPERPVEQVSFEDVQAFLARVNTLVPGLNLSLPSDAQWEYACRAGTGTATWAGDMTIMGDNNAPVLDAIAWYGGNSGVEYDLGEWMDSSGWPNKQYAHERAGTRKVGRKDANPWGLYDMLGNVWEWCADHWHDDYRGAPDDGSAWTVKEGAAVRVFRGGSWRVVARFVRAAMRAGLPPADRNGYLGFRCARVQDGELQAEPRAGRGAQGERSEPAAPPGPRRSLRRQG